MLAPAEVRKNRRPRPDEHRPMRLDAAAIEAARRSLDQGAVTPHSTPWRADIIEPLNDSLATELLCVLRCRRHHFTAEGLASPKIAERVAIESYSQLITLIGDKDSSTRRLLEDILDDEQAHAEELKDWLAD